MIIFKAINNGCVFDSFAKTKKSPRYMRKTYIIEAEMDKQVIVPAYSLNQFLWPGSNETNSGWWVDERELVYQWVLAGIPINWNI